MKIKKSIYYRVGICSITEIVGKEKKLSFDSGEAIEVTEQEYNAINALNWCELIEE